MTMKDYIREQFQAALADLKVPGEIVPAFEQPRQEAHGDLTTNVAMVLAKTAGKNPRAMAQEIVSHLQIDPDRVTAVEIAGPGFINIRQESN